MSQKERKPISVSERSMPSSKPNKPSQLTAPKAKPSQDSTRVPRVGTSGDESPTTRDKGPVYRTVEDLQAEYGKPSLRQKRIYPEVLPKISVHETTAEPFAASTVALFSFMVNNVWFRELEAYRTSIPRGNANLEALRLALTHEERLLRVMECLRDAGFVVTNLYGGQYCTFSTPREEDQAKAVMELHALLVKDRRCWMLGTSRLPLTAEREFAYDKVLSHMLTVQANVLRECSTDRYGNPKLAQYVNSLGDLAFAAGQDLRDKKALRDKTPPPWMGETEEEKADDRTFVPTPPTVRWDRDLEQEDEGSPRPSRAMSTPSQSHRRTPSRQLTFDLGSSRKGSRRTPKKKPELLLKEESVSEASEYDTEASQDAWDRNRSSHSESGSSESADGRKHRDYDRKSKGRETIIRLGPAMKPLELFDGSQDPYTNKHWWADFENASSNGGWSRRSRCSNFKALMRGPAEYWYRTLGRRQSEDWEEVKRAFKKEFCRSRDNPFDRYMRMVQASTESARQYLWRFNASAKAANINVKRSANVPQHVNWFIESLTDERVIEAIKDKEFTSIDELEDMLALLERRAGRRRAGAMKKSARSSQHEERRSYRDRERSPERSRYGSDRRPPSSRTYVAHDASPSPRGRRSTYDREYYDYGDEEGANAYPAQGGGSRPPADSRSRPPPPSPTRDRHRSESRDSGRRFDGERDGGRQALTCTTCKKTGHEARTCWSNMTCSACKGQGHPAESCYRKCEACDKVHDRGACEAKKVLDMLKDWYKKDGSSSTLPASVLQHLNC